MWFRIEISFFTQHPYPEIAQHFSPGHEMPIRIGPKLHVSRRTQMKLKIILIFLSAGLALLVGCGSQPNQDGGGSSSNGTTSFLPNVHL
jgi:hypothetical protein